MSKANRRLKALAAIDAITSDDFCEDIGAQLALHPDRLSPELKTAAEKLMLIYEIAHGWNSNNRCYHVHGSWRAMAAKVGMELRS